MDLSNDVDLDEDTCPLSKGDLPNDLPSPQRFHINKEDHLKEDRFDSRYSSGYASGNLDSGLGEGRLISDEDKIPVAGIESLTLENDDTKTRLSSVDEGFESPDLKSADLKSSDLKPETENSTACCDRSPLSTQEQEQLDIYRTVLKETYQQDDDGDTRLHTSIIHLLQDLCLYYISLTPTHTLLNLKNNYLQTPLHLAVITKQDVLTRKLMTSGALVDSKDHRGNTPLHIACREGYDYFVKILTEPIHYEETTNNTYDIPYQPIPQNLEARNYDGQMCVHLAAEGCHLDTLNVLLAIGADVNARDGKSGRTILHYAAESGCLPLLKFLLEQRHSKLDVNCVTYAGLTPVLLAQGRGHNEVTKLLKERGAWSDPEDSSEEDMMDEPYEDIKINGVIINR